MENAAGGAESRTTLQLQLRRPLRRRRALSLRQTSAVFNNRRLYRKSVCEAASTPLSTPQPLSPPATALLCAPLAPPISVNNPSVFPAAIAISAEFDSPTAPHACCNPRAPLAVPLPSCSTSSFASKVSDCGLVNALRLQVEQSLRRAREAEANECNLRLALQEVEHKQATVVRALEEYRQLKIPEGDEKLQVRVRQLEAENALLRAQLQEKESYVSKKEEETEKLSQQLFDISCTLEGFQKKHLALLEHTKEAEVSTAGAEIRFSTTTTAQRMDFSAPDASCKRKVPNASCEERSTQNERRSSFSLSSPACGELRLPQEAGKSVHTGGEGTLCPSTANIVVDRGSSARETSCNKTEACKHCNGLGDGTATARIGVTKALHAAVRFSPKSRENITQLQEENTTLKKALLEASAEIDDRGSRLRRKEEDVEQLLREKEEGAKQLRKHEGYLEQLLLKEKEAKELLQQKDREINKLQESVVREELAKAAVEQVSAKLNARVTNLLLQVRQTESRCEEMEGAYKTRIRSLEEKLTAYSPPVCLEAQTQTTLLSSSRFPFREFLELNADSFASLTFDMKKRLVASEQEKSDRLLQHERILEEKELRLIDVSVRLASATEEHAAEKKKLHAKIVQLEGELALGKTKLQTMARRLQRTRTRLHDASIAQQSLAVDKQQKTDAQQRLLSSLELRLQAEKQKLMETLCSLDVLQKHLRRLLQSRTTSNTSTQASQTEDRHSVIVEVPAEFQEQLGHLSAPQSLGASLSPARGNLQKKDKTLSKEGAGHSVFCAGKVHCGNHICVEFAVDASERICMLTAALLCKVHALCAAEERLTFLQQEFKNNYTVIEQLSEESRKQREMCRHLLRAEIDWQEKIAFLQKQNDSLRHEKREAIEQVEVLQASEAKLQQESQLLREQQGLCRKQLDDLHKEHTVRAVQERSEHEELLQTLKRYLTERHLARKSHLHPLVSSNGEHARVSCIPPQSTEHARANPPEKVHDSSPGSHLSVSSHQGELETLASDTGADLVGAIQQLTAAAVSLFARLAKTQLGDFPPTFSTSPSSASACSCAGSAFKGERTAGHTASTGNGSTQWRIEDGETGHTSVFKTTCLCSCCPVTGSTLRGSARVHETNSAVNQQQLRSVNRCVEHDLQGKVSQINRFIVDDTTGRQPVENLIHTCSEGLALGAEVFHPEKQRDGSHECARRDIMPLGTSVTEKSAVHARGKELLDQLCDLFLCAGHRLADAEYAAATNEVVACLTYKQWQLQKARENELLRDRALLRHQLQILKHQRSASQAAGDRLTRDLCQLYRNRCEEMENQQLVVLQQLHVHEEERKRLVSNLKDMEQQAHALQQRLAWLEAGKTEVKLLAESTADERVTQRLLTFKKDVLESLQKEAVHLSLVSALPFRDGGAAAEEGNYEELNQLSQQLTQERRERAALHFALKEMQQENKMMLHLLDQKEKQLTLLHEMKLSRPAHPVTTVEDKRSAKGVQADFALQHERGGVSPEKKNRLSRTGGETSQTATTSFASFCLLDVGTFLPRENDVDGTQAEFFGRLSRLKRILHEQQVEMHKQAEKLSCREIEAASLRLRNESLSSELSRHTSQLSEAQTALEDAARVRARMQEVERWASRLRHAHQAELKSMRSAQDCLLQQRSLEWEAKTNQQLTTLHAENANLKTLSEQLCGDTEALRQQLWRYQEALQRHSVLEKLSRASLEALQTFQLESSFQNPDTTVVQSVTTGRAKKAAASNSLNQHRKRGSMSSGLSIGARRVSTLRQDARFNAKPKQRLKNAVPLQVVRCLLQAFVQLCVELAECERQLLTDLSFTPSASSQHTKSSESVPPLPRPFDVVGPQHPPRETSVLRGQRIVIRWLYAYSLNRMECSPRALAMNKFTTAGALHPVNASAASYFPVPAEREASGRISRTDNEANAILSALSGSDQSVQFQPAAPDRPVQQRRLLLQLKEGAQELHSVLRESCHAVTTARCAQQLILDRLKEIESTLRFMRSITGAKRKTQSNAVVDEASTDSTHSRERRKSRRDSMSSRKRSGSRRYGSCKSCTSDSGRGRVAKPTFKRLFLKPLKGVASKKTILESEFVLSRRACSRSLSEIERLLQLVLSCAEECSSVMGKADLAAEALGVKLKAALFFQNKPTNAFPWKIGVGEDAHTQDTGILRSRMLCASRRVCPLPRRSSSSKSRYTRNKCPTTRGRSLSKCKGRLGSPTRVEKLNSKCRYTSTPIASRRSCRSCTSVAGEFFGKRRSVRSLRREVFSSRGSLSSSRSKPSSFRFTSDGSTPSGRSSPRRAQSFARSYPRTPTSATTRKPRVRSRSGETSRKSGHTKLSIYNDKSSLGHAFNERCTPGSWAASVTTDPVTPATTVSPTGGPATHEKVSRSASDCSDVQKILSGTGCSSERRAAKSYKRRTQEQVGSNTFIHGGRNDKKLGARHKFTEINFSPPSSSVALSSAKHVLKAQQSARSCSSRGTSPPQLLHPRPANANFVTPSRVSPCDGKLASGVDYFSACFMNPCPEKEISLHASSRHESTSESRSDACGSDCFPSCDCSIIASLPQNNASSAANNAEWSRDGTGEQDVSDNTIFPPTWHDTAVPKNHTASKCDIVDTIFSASKRVSGISKMCQPAACFSTNVDAAPIRNAERTNSSGHKIDEKNAKPSPPVNRDAQPLSPTQRRVVVLSPYQRRRSARQGLRVHEQKAIPRCSMGEQVKETQPQGEGCCYVVCKKPPDQGPRPVKSTPHRKVASHHEVDKLQHGKLQHGNDHSRASRSRFDALCVARPEWLPSLPKCKGFLPQASKLTGVKKDPLSSSGKARSPSVVVSYSAEQAKA